MNTTEQNVPNASSDSVPPVSGEEPVFQDACCKVQRIAVAYQLTAVDNELERRYVADDATLHELADYVNNRITAVTLQAIDNPTDIEPGTARAALQGDEGISPTQGDDLRATLAGHLDIELLTDSYVSHETIRRHLNEHLDVSTSKGGFDTFDEFKEAINSYQDQYENGVRGALRRAGEKELIEGTDFRIFSTRVECQNCSETYRLQELLENSGCDCK